MPRVPTSRVAILPKKQSISAILSLSFFPLNPRPWDCLRSCSTPNRDAARRDANGEYVPLMEQRIEGWNTAMIDEAEQLLLGASAAKILGRYQLEAAIQSAHVERRRTGRANWANVVELYDGLLAWSRSPVVAINRALAVAELEGAQAGLDALQLFSEDARLREHQPWWAARADLFARTGNHESARQAYDIVMGLEKDESVRRLLDRRRSALGS